MSIGLNMSVGLLHPVIPQLVRSSSVKQIWPEEHS